MTTNALGIVNRGRVRPTYFVPADHAARAHLRFPKAVKLNDQFTLSWRVGRWKAISDEFGWLKRRTVEAVVVDPCGLACSFDIEQTKNCDGADLPLEDYVYACDSISQSVYEESEAVALFLQSIDERPSLMDAEIVGCVARLYVPRSALGSMAWVEAIRFLTSELAKNQAWGMAFVLQASPLEMAWRNNEMSAKELEGDLGGLEVCERRQKALIRLYERTLGFASLGETGWMGLRR